MTVVVDASAVVEVITRTPLGDKVVRRLSAENALNAPEMLDLEVANAIRGLFRAGRLSRAGAEQAVATLVGLPVRRIPHLPLLSRVWALRDRLSAYDAAYVGLAQLLDTRVLTIDERLARGAPRGRVELITA